LLPAGPSASASRFVPVRARGADSLADSVGIHVRLWYEAYRGPNWPITRERLAELGIRHVYDVSQTRLERLRALGDAGIELHVLIRDDGDPEAVARALGPALASLQTDWRFGDRWKQGLLDEAWAAQARRFAETNHARVRGSRLLAGVPLLGPSVRPPYETELVGDLGAFADLGAFNFWPAPAAPDTGRLAQEMAGQASVFPGKALALTQTGYSTAPLALTRVSEPVQARYLLRLLLEAFDRGVVRTFANQLIDFDPDPSRVDGGLGLLRRDGRPKEAFFALKALLAAVADPGPAHAPDALAYQIETSEPDLRQLLLHKRDGSFLLAVWLARESQDEPVRRPVRLRLAAAARSLRVLDPHGAEPAAAASSDTLSFAAGDGVVLIEIGP
jgi:hypothetical protein